METTEVKIIVLGKEVTISSLEEEIARQISGRELAMFFQSVIKRGQTDQLRDILGILEIVTTPSNFLRSDDNELEPLKQTCEKYPLSWWLEQTGRMLTRQSIIDYWDYFMEMAGELGFKCSGQINTKGGTTNLWKACGDLYDRMNSAYRSHSAEFERLPGSEVNTAELVAGALRTTKSPKTFIQLLVGDTISNMPDWFFGAFSKFEDHKDREGCIATLMIAMQMDS